MNVCIDFISSISNILNLQQLLISHVHFTYFMVYSVKMVIQGTTWLNIEFIYNVFKKLLPFKNPCIIHHIFNKKCS